MVMLRKASVAVIFLSSVANLGLFPMDSRLIPVLDCVSLVLLSLMGRYARPWAKPISLGLALLVPLSVTSLSFPTPEASLLMVAGWLTIWILLVSSEYRPTLVDLPVIPLTVCLVLIFQRAGGNFHWILSAISEYISRLPASVGLPALTLRQTPSGALVTTAAALCALVLTGGKKIMTIVTLVLAQLLFIFVAPFIPSYGMPASSLLFFQLLFAVACSVILGAGQTADRCSRRIPGNGWIWAAAAVMLLSSVITLIPLSTELPKKIVMVRTGVTDFDVRPSEEVYGLGNLGQYGAFVDYLGAIGCKVNAIDFVNLTEETIAGADLVVIICPKDYLTDVQKSDLDRYLRLGGHVLLMGDHTNIFGTQGPFNDFAQTYGIEINYDSGLPTRNDWVGCFEQTPFLSSVCSNAVDPWVQFPYLTGATLRRSLGSQALILAKYGFQDSGNPVNGGRQAFLGNYAWDRGQEAIGDIVLACRTEIGRGTLTCIGDTSLFQALNVIVNRAGVAILHEAYSGAHSSGQALVIQILALLIISGFVVRKPTAISYTTFLLALTIVLLSLPKAPLLRQWAEPQGDRATIDVTHSVTTSLRPWREDSVYGLAAALRRAGWWPRLAFSDLRDQLKETDLLVLIGPSASYTRAECQAITNWVSSGGKLIMASSWHPDNSRLLSTFGFDIKPVPLGVWPSNSEALEAVTSPPDFTDAWPVQSDATAPESVGLVWFVQDGQRTNLVMSRSYGLGQVLLIGDERVLQDSNLESESGWNQKNIDFVHSLLDF